MMHVVMGLAKCVPKLGTEMSAQLTGHWGVFGQYASGIARQTVSELLKVWRTQRAKEEIEQ
jgi:hypothetical protein